ncbi:MULTISPECIES: hypothetical protein [Trichocoleus]|uniref:Uncharacterized protein n=1 Tax=Trichocoleus desertorum GB2-A4 TaxID=2933944 RepID=A0ABV0J310_9CYAN|nr:hypothetical protein [Trichocoleus sp. FACHB-46]MBD1860786.1 hypothetical protein [Trichocoleus sp. FACHB-46]
MNATAKTRTAPWLGASDTNGEPELIAFKADSKSGKPIGFTQNTTAEAVMPILLRTSTRLKIEKLIGF